MKIKMGLLDNQKVAESLKSLMGSKPKNPKTTYDIAIFMKKLTPQIESYQEAKNAAINTYGTPVADKPGYFEFSGENKELFTKHMEEFHNSEIEIRDLKLNAAHVPDLSVEDLMVLSEICEVVHE